MGEILKTLSEGWSLHRNHEFLLLRTVRGKYGGCAVMCISRCGFKCINRCGKSMIKVRQN